MRTGVKSNERAASREVSDASQSLRYGDDASLEEEKDSPVRESSNKRNVTPYKVGTVGQSCTGDCKVCGRLPFVLKQLSQRDLFENELLWDFEGGLFDLAMYHKDHSSHEKLPEDVTKCIAEKTSRCSKSLQRQLYKAGLISTRDQNFTGASNKARVMAPFLPDEIEKGFLLGSGGFSSVYEVANFKLKGSGMKISSYEQEARKHLAANTSRFMSDDVFRNKAKGSKKQHNVPRYAVKHLRKDGYEDSEQLQRAVIDLALEAQLLMVVDHPNIISLRGWSYGGVNSLLSGHVKDYFLVIDYLPRSLEGQINEWRMSHKKYKGRTKVLVWKKTKFDSKIHDLFLLRLQAAHNITAALEHMHDRRIINRDVKICNIGFDIHGDIKVFDFGLSRLLPPETDRVHGGTGGFVMSRVGTKYYMAPEISDKQPYDLPVDVYSLGVVLWEIMAMASCREVLKSRQHCSSREDGCPLPMCSCWSKSLSDLLLSMTANVPQQRPTMYDVRKQIWAEMESLGLSYPYEQKRRRSTLRLDLSQMEKVKIPAKDIEETISTRSSLDNTASCS